MKQRVRKKLLKNFNISFTKIQQSRRKTLAIITMLQNTITICETYKRKSVLVHRSDSSEANKKIKIIKRLQN